MTRTTTIILIIFLESIMQNAVRASHDSEKERIYAKFEIVSFGQTQSFTKTCVRIFEGIGEWFGYDLDDKSVYEKRYEALKLHWDDARAKFRKHDVDTKSEPIYFGYIDWVKKQEIPPPFPGAPDPPDVVTDHYIQFYVAARKRRKVVELPDTAKYTLHAPRSAYHGWYLDIDGKDEASKSKNGKWTIARNLIMTKEDGPSWTALKSADGIKLLLDAPKSKYDGWYLDVAGRDEFEKSVSGKWTFARNLMMTQESGPEWTAVKSKNGVKLVLDAPKSRYDGWYLDIAGRDDSVKSANGKWTFSRNLIMTKEDGPEWNVK